MTEDKPKAEEKPEKSRPWRDNIEAVTMAIVMAVFLKYFIIEAYKIPTGSMQPTLMGAELKSGKGVFDRILVDKLSYHFRDPERWEVAVFRYPLDRSKNFIKRVVGLPGEDVRIRHGDIWVRSESEPEWRVARRSRPVQRETWKRLELDGGWKPSRASEEWEVDGREIVATGPGSVQFPRSGGSIRDTYTDGYPGEMARNLRRVGSGGERNDVGDVRVEGEIEAEDDLEALVIHLSEGEMSYELRIPGPAAPEGDQPSIAVKSSGPANGDGGAVALGEAYRLRAGRSVDFGAQNLDDLIELELDGEVVCSIEVEPVESQRGSRIVLETAAGGASFDDLAIYRDIYYTPGARSPSDTWEIPGDSYFMLGDNTQDSSDSREWREVEYTIRRGPDAGKVLVGNNRNNENPLVVSGRPGGTEVYFRDIYGELHTFLRADSDWSAGGEQPFVPRGLITGRALLVFWPIVPSLDVYRLKWIH